MRTTIAAGWISCPKCSRRARGGQMYCELCGTRLHEAGEPGAAPTRSQKCDQCGATMLVSEDERTATCAFCGTPYVRAGEARPDRLAPEFVLPFTVSRREAEEAFRAWLGTGGIFCPGDLAAEG